VRRLPLLTILAGGLVLAFGGLSLLLGDDRIYKMKPTVLYSLFAIALLAAMGMKRLLLKAVLEDAWKLTERGWRKLTVQFAGFFLVMAALNEIAWRFVGEDFWVNFKVFGGVGLTLAFVMSRVPFAKKHALPDPEAKAPPEPTEPDQV
jgi:intracellular septation protein